MRTRLGRC